MVEALVTNGLPNDGYELLRELRQDEAVRPLLNAVMYCSVLKGFSHQKSFSQTWKVYLEMLEDRLEFSIVTFNTLIDACARCGEMSRVPKLLKSMNDQRIEPNLITYCAILKGYCRENELESAFKLVEDMRRTTSLIPDEIMYNSLLDGCARKGLFDKGVEVVAEMEAAFVKPTNFTLSLLMKLAGRSGQLEKGFELFEDIPRRHHFQPNVHVYANLVQTCLQHHALSRALSLVQKMAQVRVRPDGRMYGMLIRACVGSGDVKIAEALLRAAFGLKGGYFGLLGLKNACNLLSSEVSDVFDAMTSRNDKAAVDLARDLKTEARFEIDSRKKMRLIGARS
jgi:pentatricopeptide repeat protein